MAKKITNEFEKLFSGLRKDLKMQVGYLQFFNGGCCGGKKVWLH